MRKERCKYLPNCNRPSTGRLGETPICIPCAALHRMKAREEAKKVRETLTVSV